MPRYQVSWKIEIDADSPREAAIEAHIIQRDQESIALVFDVSPTGGEVQSIDLAEHFD